MSLSISYRSIIFSFDFFLLNIICGTIHRTVGCFVISETSNLWQFIVHKHISNIFLQANNEYINLKVFHTAHIFTVEIVSMHFITKFHIYFFMFITFGFVFVFFVFCPSMIWPGAYTVTLIRHYVHLLFRQQSSFDHCLNNRCKHSSQIWNMGVSYEYTDWVQIWFCKEDFW